ncbi:MAG: hypothetical protein BWY76_01919 [bacterium ADurb.Bin429]|nr:MAG: hypothetical protein BWY76_01919 [bacterium ADurb.Bin429]
MTLFRLIARGLRHYHRTGLAIIFGVAVAAAALTGSLLVGHSVSGSLRDTALARLGNISHAVTAPREFRAQLAPDLRSHSWARDCSALYLATGAVTNADTDAVVPKVNIIGVDDGFWKLFDTKETLDGRQAIANAALARDLNLRKDDACLINLVHGGTMSSGNLFAQRSLDATQHTLRVTIADILPDRGAGGFSLTVGSATPRNLFVSREWLLEMLDKGDSANGMVVHAWFKFEDGLFNNHSDVISESVKDTCTLQDYGLSLVPDKGLNCLLLRSVGMVLPNIVVTAGREAAEERKTVARRTSVYLAERIYRPTIHFNWNTLFQPQPKLAIGKSISYVLLAGIERQPGKYDFLHAKNPVLLNAWAAEDLGIEGFSSDNNIILESLVPSLDGHYTTKPFRLQYAGTVPINPAHAALVPPIDGVSDADRIDAWQVPFPVDMARITDRDEAYWEQYKTTPKAYVDLETIRKMWASGPQGEGADWVTSLMVTPPAGKTLNVGESSGATITRLGSSGYWTSITVQDSGKISLYPGSIVEYAKTGITSLSNETDAIKVYPAYSPYATIRHCRDFGIYTYNCSPTISLLKLIYHDNLYYPSTGIRVAGSISNPTISTVTFDSTQTEFSMEPYTDASLGYSDLRNAANVVDNIYIGAYSSLNMDGLYGSNGYNNIYPGSGYTINNVPSSDWVEAGCNYFAGSPSFRQSIMINYLESSFGSACNNGAPPLSKPAILASNPFAEEKSREEIGDWSGAIAIYKDILANNSEISARRRAIKSILHASEQRNIKNKTNDYREIRSIVLTELNSATSAYKAVLDYLLCEILVKEGKYSDAISSYAAQAVKYSGTSMEVEMLTRVATLYGMQLKNKVKAREFADRASAINPGQDYLYIAYRAAGAEYLPWQYADKFKGIEENFDTPPEQPKPTAEDEYVAINPNPANPVATITYSINSPSNVRLSIYSITGQKVATLADGPMSAGTHSVIFDGSKYASGVYFYRFESAGLTKSGKMLLLK